MTNILQTQQLFSGLQYGLQRVFTVLGENNTKGISLENLTDYSTLFKNTGLTIADIPFIQYLQQNMGNIDTDSNGKITEKEISNMLSTMQNYGYTYQQLVSMAVTGNTGLDQSLLQTVLSNFNKVDVNHDGRVSQDEISSYQINKEVEDKKSEYTRFKATDMSVYYSDNITETEDSDEDSRKTDSAIFSEV